MIEGRIISVVERLLTVKPFYYGLDPLRSRRAMVVYLSRYSYFDLVALYGVGESTGALIEAELTKLDLSFSSVSKTERGKILHERYRNKLGYRRFSFSQR